MTTTDGKSELPRIGPNSLADKLFAARPSELDGLSLTYEQAVKVAELAHEYCTRPAPTTMLTDTALRLRLQEKIDKWLAAIVGDCNCSACSLNRQHAAELEQLIASPDQSNWQAIESAPKDGTDFIGYWDDDELHVVCIRDGECYRAMDRKPWAMPTLWHPLPPLPLPPASTKEDG